MKLRSGGIQLKNLRSKVIEVRSPEMPAETKQENAFKPRIIYPSAKAIIALKTISKKVSSQKTNT